MDFESLIPVAGVAVIIISLVYLAKSSRRSSKAMEGQARGIELCEQTLSLQAETNQLLHELIAAVRDKR